MDNPDKFINFLEKLQRLIVDELSTPTAVQQDPLPLKIKNNEGLSKVNQIAAALKQKYPFIPETAQTEHPFGEKIGEAYLSIRIWNTEPERGLISFEFPNNRGKVQNYFYDTKKQWYNNGQTWKLEDEQCYLVHAIKYSGTNHWVWESAWALSQEEWERSTFKISGKLSILVQQQIDKLEKVL